MWVWVWVWVCGCECGMLGVMTAAGNNMTAVGHVSIAGNVSVRVLLAM